MLANQEPREKEMANYQKWLNQNKNGTVQGGVVCVDGQNLTLECKVHKTQDVVGECVCVYLDARNASFLKRTQRWFRLYLSVFPYLSAVAWQR